MKSSERDSELGIDASDLRQRLLRMKWPAHHRRATELLFECLAGPLVSFQMELLGTGEPLATLKTRPLYKIHDLRMKLDQELKEQVKQTKDMFDNTSQASG